MNGISVALATTFEPWAQLYGDTTALQVAVVFTHLAGILLGGGAAVALDRAALRVARGGDGERAAHLAALSASHRVVLTGLALTVASGLLLFAADIETYLGSVGYWTKMGLFALLLANGAWMQRAERRLQGGDADPAGWGAIRRSSLVSLVLWFAVLLAGVVVVNAS